MTPLATVLARVDGAVEGGSAAVVLNNSIDLRRAIDAMIADGWGIVRSFPDSTTMQLGRGADRRSVQLLNLEWWS